MNYKTLAYFSISTFSWTVSIPALIIFIFWTATGLSQNRKIDSLKSLLPIAKTSSDRLDILVNLARGYNILDMHLTLYYASEAFDLARHLGDSLQIVRTGRIKCQSLKALGHIDASLKLYNEVLLIAKRNNFVNELKFILNGLGIGYSYKADFDKALESHFASLDLRKESGDRFEISVALNNIGLVYSELEDYEQALVYYKQALKLKNEIDNKYDLDILLLNISLCYANSKHLAASKKYLEQALSICGKNCNEDIRSISNHIYGIIFFTKQNFCQAEKHFIQSYGLSKKVAIDPFHLDNIIYLMRIYISREQLEEADKYLKEAELLITSELPYNNEIIKIYAELFSLYSKSNNFERVAYYQNKYITLKDSIYNKELTTNLMKIEAEHLEKENKAKIAFQNKILSLNQQVIFSQKTLNVAIGTIAILVTIVAALLAKNNRQKKQANVRLEEKVRERTQTLLQNRDELQRVFEERDAVFSRAGNDVKSAIASIKGLYLLTIRDIDRSNTTKYLEKMNFVSDHLLDTVNKILNSAGTATPTRNGHEY